MTKQEMINKINNVPDDILEAGYVFELIQSGYIQMNLDSNLLKKYHLQIELISISQSGFLEFSLFGQKIRMT